MSPENDKNRIKLLLFSGVVLFLIIPMLFFVISSSRETVTVDNYGTYAKDLPSEQRNLINDALYQVVKLNFADGEKMMRSVALIRKGSSVATYDTDRDVHSGSFIIDLKDIRQSYHASYDWSENKDNPNTSGYPIKVVCLSEDELIIYKDFRCKDGSEGSSLPLEYQLPYTDVSGPFEIVYMYKQEDTPVIGIVDSTPNGRQKALNWLRSKNVDPTDVVINYLDINDRLGDFRYGTE